ncbi:hypothetical protein SRABI26_03811 [Arthrobacter sp. Bi26]|nr:hypothetical protein SRABI26_03811 [Arthrobacter sp. Bi26]
MEIQVAFPGKTSRKTTNTRVAFCARPYISTKFAPKADYAALGWENAVNNLGQDKKF